MCMRICRGVQNAVIYCTCIVLLLILLGIGLASWQITVAANQAKQTADNFFERDVPRNPFAANVRLD